MSRWQLFKNGIKNFIGHQWGRLKNWTEQKSQTRTGRGLISLGTGGSIALGIYGICNLIFPPLIGFTVLTAVLTGVSFVVATAIKSHRLNLELQKNQEKFQIVSLQTQLDKMILAQNRNNALFREKIIQITQALPELTQKNDDTKIEIQEIKPASFQQSASPLQRTQYGSVAPSGLHFFNHVTPQAKETSQLLQQSTNSFLQKNKHPEIQMTEYDELTESFAKISLTSPQRK